MPYEWLAELYLGEDFWTWGPLPREVCELILEFSGLIWHGRRCCGFVVFHPRFFSTPN